MFLLLIRSFDSSRVRLNGYGRTMLWHANWPKMPAISVSKSTLLTSTPTLVSSSCSYLISPLFSFCMICCPGKSFLRLEDYYCYAAAALHLVADVEKVNSNVTHLFNVSYPRVRAIPSLVNLTVALNQSHSSSSLGSGIGVRVGRGDPSLLTVLGGTLAVVFVVAVCIFQCIVRRSTFTTRSPPFAPSSAR